MTSTEYAYRRSAAIIVVKSFTRFDYEAGKIVRLMPGTILEGDVDFLADGSPGWFNPKGSRFEARAFGPPELVNSRTNERSTHWRLLTPLELLALEATD